MTTFFKTYVCKPLDRPSVQGRHLNQVYEKKDGQVKMLGPAKRTKGVDTNGESITETVTVADCRSQHDRTRYNLGLSKMIENPFKDAPEKIMQLYSLKEEWRPFIEKIVNQDEITKQTFGEIRFNLLPNELTEQVPPRPTKENPDTRTRIMKKKVILYDRPNMFKEDNLDGWLSIQILLNAPNRVATSPQSANSAIQNWIMLEESVEQKLSTDSQLKQNKAIGEYAEYCLNYPVTEALENNVVYFIASLLPEKTGNKTRPLLSGVVNAKTIDDKINDYLKPKDKGTIEQNIEEFNKVVKLHKEQPDLFFAKYLVQQALNTQTIQPSNGYLYWVSQKNKPESIETYRFNSQDTFTTFIYNEMLKMDSPIFIEFIKELKGRNVVIPSQFNQ